MKHFRFWLIGFLILLMTGCSQQSNRAKGVYMLLDTSGTYAMELKKARLILKTKQRHRKGHIERTHNNYLGTGFLADIID